MPDPLILLLLLAGPVAGSFIGVLADRLVRGEDVVARPSSCRACGARLGPRDLVPVLSFALARGRCRVCGEAIPPWLLYAEIAAAGLAVIAVIVAPGTAAAWALALVLWLLLALALCDLLWMRLPDLLTGTLLVAALLHGWASGWPPLPLAALGAGLGAGSFALLRWGYRALRGREGLGMGDVKLMAGCGAALGPYDLPLMVLIASATALAVALAGRTSRADALAASRALPFGAALAVATALLLTLT